VRGWRRRRRRPPGSVCSRILFFSARHWCDLGKYGYVSCFGWQEGSERVIHCRVVSMVRPALRPSADGGAPSSSQVLLGRGGDEGGILAMVQEANMTCEALHDVTQEERRLREYTSVTRVALDTTYEEAGEAGPWQRRSRWSLLVNWIPPSSGFI
jgi:hypothetical protein